MEAEGKAFTNTSKELGLLVTQRENLWEMITEAQNTANDTFENREHLLQSAGTKKIDVTFDPNQNTVDDFIWELLQKLDDVEEELPGNAILDARYKRLERQYQTVVEVITKMQRVLRLPKESWEKEFDLIKGIHSGTGTDDLLDTFDPTDATIASVNNLLDQLAKRKEELWQELEETYNRIKIPAVLVTERQRSLLKRIERNPVFRGIKRTVLPFLAVAAAFVAHRGTDASYSQHSVDEALRNNYDKNEQTWDVSSWGIDYAGQTKYQAVLENERPEVGKVLSETKNLLIGIKTNAEILSSVSPEEQTELIKGIDVVVHNIGHLENKISRLDYLANREEADDIFTDFYSIYNSGELPTIRRIIQDSKQNEVVQRIQADLVRIASLVNVLLFSMGSWVADRRAQRREPQGIQKAFVDDNDKEITGVEYFGSKLKKGLFPQPKEKESA